MYQPTLTGQAESSSCSDQGGEEDDTTLIDEAASQALTKLREDVTPHVHTLNLQLKTEVADLDEPTRTRFAGAMAFARADRMDRACAAWRQLLEENPRSLTLGFDVAIKDRFGDYASQRPSSSGDLAAEFNDWPFARVK